MNQDPKVTSGSEQNPSQWDDMGKEPFRGKIVQASDGSWIPEVERDAYEEALDRAKFDNKKASRTNAEENDAAKTDEKDEFVGERNINDKTGKKRTFTEFDIYPKMPGETNEQYGARLRFMHEKTTEFEAAEAKKEYLSSEFGQKEIGEEQKFDRLQEKIEQAVKEGRISEEHAKALLEQQLERSVKEIEGHRQDYEDSKVVGTEEEQAAYQEWLNAHEAENQANLEARAAEAADHEEELAKAHEEELAKAHEEELAKAHEEELAKARAAELAEAKRTGKLTAINADFTHDRDELASHYAEQELNSENAKSGFFKRLWKGQLFRKYYHRKYQREIASGERTFDMNGEQVDIDDVIGDSSNSAMRRFIMGVLDDPETSRFIHRNIGGEGKGEKVSEADPELTAAVRAEIEKFAQAKIPEGGSLDDLRTEFGNAIRQIQAERRDAGKDDEDAKLINNYYLVAIQARELAEHGVAIEDVMEGFKVYNADVRNNQRTEKHRDNIDKIVNKIESSAIGRLVPAEIVAGVVGSAWALTQTGARAAAGVAGGLIVSGAFAGLRERNRVTEDRAKMLRDAAVGLEYSGTAEGAEVKGRAAKKRAKYEARIGGTLYELTSASELTNNLNQALEGGNNEEILRALAEARVRIDFSDSEQKDLISYSSADKMGDERYELDLATIVAERRLSEADRDKLNNMMAVVSKEISENVDEKDDDFRRVRAAEALKQAGKTMAIGAALFFGSQELTAALSPDKIGIFEKLGVLKTNNAENAQETILASLAGPRGAYSLEVHGISGDQEATISDLESEGYIRTEVEPSWSEPRSTVTEASPAESVNNVRVEKFYADNGTRVSDGQELRLYLRDGEYFTGMRGGTSTMGNQVFSYDELAANGQIRGLINIGGGNFYVESALDSAGNITWPIDAAGNITTTTGEVIKVFSDNGEKLFNTFSVGGLMGTNAEGVDQFVSFATDVGRNSFEGTIKQITETVVEHPAIYDFTKTITREVYAGGIAGGVANRVGLGEVGQPGEEQGTPPSNDGETSPTPEEENTGEQASEPNTETAPGLTEEQERTRSNLEAFIVDRLSDGEIDASGARIITETSPLTPELATRFEEYWSNLNEAQRTKVIDIQRQMAGRTNLAIYGRTFREWLASQTQ